MAKLIVKSNTGTVLRVPLPPGGFTLGRLPGNDLVIDDPAVSDTHARILSVGGDSFLEDLGGANGTYVNNRKIERHHLVQGDIVTLGNHELLYTAAGDSEDEARFALVETDSAFQREDEKPGEPRVGKGTPFTSVRMQRKPGGGTTRVELRAGGLFLLNGPYSGRRIALRHRITRLGRGGKRTLTISRSDIGYVIEYTGDGENPVLNGKVMGKNPSALANADLIEVGDLRLRFYLE